jgi:hypothetical protein
VDGQRQLEIVFEGELQHRFGEPSEVQLLGALDFASRYFALVAGEVDGSDARLELVEHFARDGDAQLLQAQTHSEVPFGLVAYRLVGQRLSVGY